MDNPAQTTIPRRWSCIACGARIVLEEACLSGKLPDEATVCDVCGRIVQVDGSTMIQRTDSTPDAPRTSDQNMKRWLRIVEQGPSIAEVASLKFRRANANSTDTLLGYIVGICFVIEA